MTKEEALKKIESGDGDFLVFTETEHKEFLNNLKESDIFKQQIDTRVSEIYKQIDADVSSITGEKKPASEKTYDYVKNQLTVLKTQADELATKNTELQKAVEDKSNDEAFTLMKKELDQVKRTHQEKLTEWKAERETMQTDTVKMRVNNALDQSMMGLKFKTDIPEDARNAMIQIAKEDINRSAKFINDKLVFIDENGEVRLDEMMRPLSAQTILETRLKSIVDPGRKLDGVDLKDPVTKKDGKTIVNLTLPDSVKTNVDLSNFLSESGLKRGNEDYNAAYEKYRDKVKVIT